MVEGRVSMKNILALYFTITSITQTRHSMGLVSYMGPRSTTPMCGFTCQSQTGRVWVSCRMSYRLGLGPHRRPTSRPVRAVMGFVDICD